MNAMDSFGIVKSFSELSSSWMSDMQALVDISVDLHEELTAQQNKAVNLVLDSGRSRPSAGPENTFTEFARKNGAIAGTYHQTLSRWFKRLTQESPSLTDEQRKRASFWVDQIFSSMAPQNFFWMNPFAVNACLESNGKSLEANWNAWLEDMRQGQLLPPLVNRGAFSVGKNLATTPGYVVFRNFLMEVIQYDPVAEKVYERPIVLIQPLINKYYIFDLSESNSFVRFLIRQGFTVFITSWKNPTADMRNVSFEDYMIHGALEAIQIARRICRADAVHAAGYCIGGTLLACLMAWLNHEGRSFDRTPVSDWTLFSTLVDFSDPGPVMVFTEPGTVSLVESLMAEKGYLGSRYLQTAFRMLKAEHLIWRPYVMTYLLGQPPPASDVLYWNSDGTRLTESLASFLLRALYRENRLVQKDGLVLGMQPIDLGRITQPLYVVGAQQDHICPWKSTFAVCGRVGAPVRYVLSSEGHITGIVKPPAAKSKKKFWAKEASGQVDPEKWLSQQEIQQGSWWEDWCEWLSVRSGPSVTAPDAGGGVYAPLEGAPGSYVLESDPDGKLI